MAESNKAEWQTRLKTTLIKTLGETPVAHLHGLRFAVLVKTKPSRDLEIGLLDRILRPGGVAVDVGANGANWTYELSLRVGADGLVLAFEADPYYAKATKGAIRWLRMRNVRFFSYGLSDDFESLNLSIWDADGNRLSGRSFLTREANPSDSGQRVAPAIGLRPLDSLRSAHPELKQVRLLKCDVEGFELHVLRGAAKILKHSQPVTIFEANASGPDDPRLRKVHSFLTGLGYATYAMSAEGRLHETDEYLSSAQAASVNRVALGPEDVADFCDIIQAIR